MKSRFVAIGVLLLLISPQMLSAAEETATEGKTFVAATACTRDIDRALNRERFLYQSVLYGIKPAAEEKAGATRVDSGGSTWIKNDNGEWVSEGPKERRSDSDMDQKTTADPLRNFSEEPQASSETPAIRRGILETQQAITSDLIPPVLQSFRAFQCRIESVCEGVSKVTGYSHAGDDSTMNITIPGCDEIPVQPIASCEPSPLMNWNDIATIRSHCDPVSKGLVRYQEAQMLFLTHEDAGHRTLRQFAGYLEPVLEKLRFPFISPLRQVADFIAEWTRVPCFLPFCAD